MYCNVLMTFDSDEKLKAFATEKLVLNEKQTKEFINIHLKQDFASLSLKAIKKVLPYLRQGLIYSHAVFLANMEEVVPAEIWKDDENKTIIRNTINDIITSRNEEKQITEIINGLIKRNKEAEATWSEEAVELYRVDLLSQVKNYFGKNRFEAFPEEKKTTHRTTCF